MLRRGESGFTLVELVIVVGIIGVLASMAIPQYVAVQNTARRAEVPSLVDSLQTAEVGYFMANDKYLIIDSFVPREVPTRVPAMWPAESDFTGLDWSADGAVRGIYKIEGTAESSFRVIGKCDVDNDGDMAEYYATQDSGAQRATPVTTY
ncbi:MAG: prepilin-type N-terminal cleavage/methylation domain-containing protein [Myxococcota bacterium]